MNLCQFHRIIADVDSVLEIFRRRGLEVLVLEITIKKVPTCAGLCGEDLE